MVYGYFVKAGYSCMWIRMFMRIRGGGEWRGRGTWDIKRKSIIELKNKIQRIKTQQNN